MDLSDLIERNAAFTPDKSAIIFEGESLSYAAFNARIEQTARALKAEFGVSRGDRVAILSLNRPDYLVLLYACARLGAMLVPLNWRLAAAEQLFILTDASAKVLVLEQAFAEILPALEKILPDASVVGLDFAPPKGISFDALLKRGHGDGRNPHTDLSCPLLIVYTSGTTGRPKGAMLAHCNIIHSAMIYEACMELTSADRSIAAVPLAHVTGVVANIMSMVRCAGTLIIVAEFKAAEYLKIAARERVTQTVMVPAMYNLCLLQADFDGYDLRAWRIGGFGGAPMPIATIEKLAVKLPGLKLINAYGSTETTSPSTIMPPELTAAHIDSVGLPCPGADIIVVDAGGRELPRGEIGEIWIRSASVIGGYWNNPNATAESFTGGFWHSGDLGSIDAENFVRVFDRQKDMINRGGLKIYSAEVESVLAGHPDVVESAIIAKPCPVLGERVHAVIVVRNSVSAEALRAWCAERLSDYKVPETIDLTAEPLPRNANGKVMKRQLREAWAAGQS